MSFSNYLVIICDGLLQLNSIASCHENCQSQLQLILKSSVYLCTHSFPQLKSLGYGAQTFSREITSLRGKSHYYLQFCGFFSI